MQNYSLAIVAEMSVVWKKLSFGSILRFFILKYGWKEFILHSQIS